MSICIFVHFLFKKSQKPIYKSKKSLYNRITLDFAEDGDGCMIFRRKQNTHKLYAEEILSAF